MANLPYFPFYPADWLSSPRIMCSTLVQQGAYIRLLCACWLSGDCSLPDDNKSLSLLTGLPEHELDYVRGFFVPHPRKSQALTNERLLKEWEKAHWISEKRSQAGKKSGKSRRTRVQQESQQGVNKIGTGVDKSESESESDIRSQKQIQKKRKKKTCDQPSVVAMVRDRYAEAYQARYRTKPVENARSNGQFAQLVKRLGVDAAPEVAAFYVWHNDQFYVRNTHPVGLLLKNAEALHTQWRTGQTITSSQARKIDQTQGRVSVFQELINERNGEVIHVEANS